MNLTQFDNLYKTKLIVELMENPEESGQTIIHCSYVSKREYVNGGWVNIWPTTYLKSVADAERLQLIHALDISVAPAIDVFHRPGELKRFTLLFPGIPNYWDQFDFIEETAQSILGFSVKNMKRNNGGVYYIELL